MSNSNSFYKILSLDGGGSWALIEAATLADIYGLDTPGRIILQQFDLAVANSGGSIVLACLIFNLTPCQILDILFDEMTRKSIFVLKPWYEKFLDFRKYSNEEKIKGLRSVFYHYSDKNWSDVELTKIYSEFDIKINTDIIITAFDYDRERAKLFRSNKSSKSAGISLSLSSEEKTTLVEAIHASSSAPVIFFDDPVILKNNNIKKRYWDGGVAGFNNPVMVGVLEALANGKVRNNIRVLSIGTGNKFLPIWQQETRYPDLYKKPQVSGLINDIKLLAHAITDDPPDNASYAAHIVLDGMTPNTNEIVTDGNIVRMNPLVKPIMLLGEWQLPNMFDLDEFKQITELDMDAIKKNDVELIKKLTLSWLMGGVGSIDNQGIRRDGGTLELEIGHETYLGSLTHWQSFDNHALTGNNWLINHAKVLAKLSS